MRSISRCLNKQLAEICQRSLQLEALSHKLSHHLPENLAKACQIGSFNKGCLILTTSSATWASQLRYAIPELRDKLRKEAGMYQLSSIKVAITEPVIHYEQSTPQKKHHLSEKTKAIIINESQQCRYEPLKKALMHLVDD